MINITPLREMPAPLKRWIYICLVANLISVVIYSIAFIFKSRSGDLWSNDLGLVAFLFLSPIIVKIGYSYTHSQLQKMSATNDRVRAIFGSPDQYDLLQVFTLKLFSVLLGLQAVAEAIGYAKLHRVYEWFVMLLPATLRTTAGL